MDPQSTAVEKQIARIAGLRHGVVTRAELLAAGLSAEQIRKRVRKGSLLRQYPGVYRVGHQAPSVEAGYMAAVLACGDGARLSGRAAAHLHCLIKGAAPPPEVTAPNKREVRGVKTHRGRLEPGHVTKVRGISVTTVARTLVDLAAELDEDELARACHEAGVRYRTTPAQVKRVLKRRPTATGATELRRVMDGDVPVSLSEIEAVFIARLREANLPLPKTNKPAGGKRVDCRWPGLTVELISYRFHNSRYAWERDQERQREAYERGDAFRTYTWKDVVEDPRQMLGELTKLLLN